MHPRKAAAAGIIWKANVFDTEGKIKFEEYEKYE